MADLSIEEANKIRVAMGIAPLPVPGAASSSGPVFKESKAADDSDDEPASTVDTRQAAAYDNWQKLQDEQKAAKKKAERNAAIKKEGERAGRFAKLEGKGLADVDDEDDMAWLKGSKKRAKQIAKAEQMARDLEDRERQAREAMQYTEADLAGVKVGHEVDQFEDGEDQILVLKDTAVDAEDDDELEAVSLKDKERLQEKLDTKKRKRVYDPNDDGQTGILAQYDEEIDGKKRKAFTLDGQGRTVEQVQAEAAGASKPKRVAISLDILQDDTPANDYMDISEVKMKKPKKKKKTKSSKRQRVEDDDELAAMAEDPADEMDVEEPVSVAGKPKKKFNEDQSFVDDDDLQAQLAAQRRLALKKRKKTRPEDIARQLREESTPATPNSGAMDTAELLDFATEADDALVIDETTEFVHNLKASAHDDDEEELRQTQRRATSHISEGVKSSTAGQIDDDGDVNMGQSYAEAGEAEDRDAEATDPAAAATNLTETGLEAEKTTDQGLGATLALLRQRGVLASTDGDDRNALTRERETFLAEKRRAEEKAERIRKDQRERERNTARWNTMTRAERDEWSRKNNVAADQMESRISNDLYNKKYKPIVELKYVDEHGRHLDQKEAFKMLSHQFHGKGSGNTKTKKHLDKIAAENRKLAESSLDISRAGGLSGAQDQQAKKNKFAGVRLQ
ncbi:unnamed protein product [Periconia digitata]|uniref:Uncharacterized protein n=1 Tax=Periconia digitata TaxID=1303443 RepID=A0A9W4XPU3_9PLEO|nr:unnamed protein product [Periconia digitata]